MSTVGHLGLIWKNEGKKPFARFMFVNDVDINAVILFSYTNTFMCILQDIKEECFDVLIILGFAIPNGDFNIMSNLIRAF